MSSTTGTGRTPSAAAGNWRSSSSQGFSRSAGDSAAVAAQAKPPRSISPCGHAKNARIGRLIKIQAARVVAGSNAQGKGLRSGKQAGIGGRKAKFVAAGRAAEILIDRLIRLGQQCKSAAARAAVAGFRRRIEAKDVRGDNQKTGRRYQSDRKAAAGRMPGKISAAKPRTVRSHQRPIAARRPNRRRTSRREPHSTRPSSISRPQPKNPPAWAVLPSRAEAKPTTIASSSNPPANAGQQSAGGADSGPPPRLAGRPAAGRRLRAAFAEPRCRSSPRRPRCRLPLPAPDSRAATWSRRNGVLMAPSHQVRRPATIRAA